MKRRLWLQIMAIVMLVVQGLYDLTPCYAAVFTPLPQKPTPTAPIQPHTQYCRCRMCAGGTKCCCRPTQDPLERVLLSAACDETGSSHSAVARFAEARAVPPRVILLLYLPLSERVPLPTLTETARVRSSQPPTQPPRLF